jgi:hypothetical protein
MSFNDPFKNFFENKKQEIPEVPSDISGSEESEPTFPKGEYKVKATYINREGNVVTRNIDFSVHISSLATEDVMRRKATGNLTFVGLHNFGMDHSHPVTIEIEDKDKNTVMSYTQVFDGSGHPVKT